MSLLRNQKGFTLLEILFALGILIVGVYLITEGVNQMTQSSRDTRLLSSTERTINSIVDNIRTGLGLYQINYDTSPSVQQKLVSNLDQLPMAWGPGTVIPVATCAPPPLGTAAADSCPKGRYGFVITPVANSNFRGLYTVTLVMTTPEWKEPYREFQFLVTVQ